ncbi:MAG: tRNA dimethylallyltransferase [Leptospiraceae bacterium]|nr:MAG: tRNA dimethylallyltransferase [Leptospiraceae bacterium]
MGKSLKKLYVIMGPTGIGKTDLLYRYLSQKPNLFEVISVDSRQIYKFMPIGTATPEPYVKEKIPHYLVEFLEPDQIYSAGNFVKDAERLINDIWERNKIPILCGGTGFYFKAFYTGMFFLEEDKERKQKIKKMLDEMTEEERLKELQKIDPDSISKENQSIRKGIIHPNDKYRIYRSLELYYLTGKTLRMHYLILNQKQKLWEFEGIFIIPEKEKWERQLKIRAEKMVHMGFIKEALYIFKKYGNCPALKTPGYKETYDLYQKFGDKILYDNNLKNDIISILYKTHKKYGKMQLKWFKNEKALKHVSYKEAEKFLENILNITLRKD